MWTSDALSELLAEIRDYNYFCLKNDGLFTGDKKWLQFRNSNETYIGKPSLVHQASHISKKSKETCNISFVYLSISFCWKWKKPNAIWYKLIYGNWVMFLCVGCWTWITKRQIKLWTWHLLYRIPRHSACGVVSNDQQRKLFGTHCFGWCLWQ